MSGELYPPGQYGWGWIVLAVGIIALVVVLAWIVLALTAPKRPRPLPNSKAAATMAAMTPATWSAVRS